MSAWYYEVKLSRKIENKLHLEKKIRYQHLCERFCSEDMTYCKAK